MASTAAAASATDADVEADTAATAVVVVGGSGAGGNAGAVSDGDGGKEEKQSSGGYRLGPDGTPASNEAYTTQQYWEARYDSEPSYEWLASFEALEELVKQHIKPSDRILMIGCGNSPFSADMYDHGYTNIVNTDFSKTVIDNMKDKYKSKTGMKWEVADMRDLSAYKDASFDVVVDKAGMDALLANGGDTFSPPEALLKDTAAVAAEVRRVLKPAPVGIFVQISFSQPHFRKLYLDDPHKFGWSFQVHKIDVGFGYFWYTMRMLSATQVEALVAARKEALAAAAAAAAESSDDSSSSDDDDGGNVLAKLLPGVGGVEVEEGGEV